MRKLDIIFAALLTAGVALFAHRLVRAWQAAAMVVEPVRVQPLDPAIPRRPVPVPSERDTFRTTTTGDLVV